MISICEGSFLLSRGRAFASTKGNQKKNSFETGHWREDPFSSKAAFLCPWDYSSIGQNPVKAKAIGSTLTLIFKGGPFLSSLGQRKNDCPREDVTDL
ncbi:UNVERIFIED_CONTAM: hypothetical protein Slati_4586200, partial [Sesamum latifolium]|uniref:Uncharacterized protein n=1 Tax=Sesamum latifolium TaxID=2727402 RepID=A0AAW2S377_9LAMI